MSSTAHRDVPGDTGARLWRVVFVCYSVVLTVGTHWPRLDLGVDDVPAPDKILHMVGFGGLCLLCWLARWRSLRGRIGLLGLIMFAWALLDELTQAVGIFGRVFSWLDVAGSWLGIAAALMWIWALRPIGGPVSLKRHQINWRIVDELFLRPRTWAAVAGTGGIISLVSGVLAGVYVCSIEPDAVLIGFAAGAVPGGALGVAGVVLVLWRQSRRQLDIPRLPGPAVRAGLWYGIAAFIGGAGLLAALLMAAQEAGVYQPWVAAILGDRWVDVSIPLDLRLVIDLAGIAALGAFSLRVARETIAGAMKGARVGGS